MGTTGLLNIPGGDMQPEGAFMAGGNYLPEEMTPDFFDHATGNYFVNITFLSFAEVAYRCTLMKKEFIAGQKWQQDRSLTLRLRPLKEGKYHPSLVVGSDDLIKSSSLNPFTTGERYFASVYAVGTKHVEFDGHTLGFTAGAYFFSDHSLAKNIFYGIRYTPAFLKAVSLLAEYDTNGVNTGATARLFKYFSVHLFAYNFKAVSGGIRYEFQLIR
jgi:hypothetical protein